MISDLFRVTAGGSALRQFFSRKGAMQYAGEVVCNSHRNIGTVCVQGRDWMTGDWKTIHTIGTPSEEVST